MGIDEQTKLDWVNVSMQLEMLTFQIRLLVSVLTTQLSIRLPVSALGQPVKGDLHTRTPTLHVGLQDGTSGIQASLLARLHHCIYSGMEETMGNQSPLSPSHYIACWDIATKNGVTQTFVSGNNCHRPSSEQGSPVFEQSTSYLCECHTVKTFTSGAR